MQLGALSTRVSVPVVVSVSASRHEHQRARESSGRATSESERPTSLPTAGGGSARLHESPLACSEQRLATSPSPSRLTVTSRRSTRAAAGEEEDEEASAALSADGAPRSARLPRATPP